MDNNYGSRIGKNSIIYMIKPVVGFVATVDNLPVCNAHFIGGIDGRN